MQPEGFAQAALDAVALHGLADRAGNRDSQAARGAWSGGVRQAEGCK